MKKITLLFAFVCVAYIGVNAQAKKQLNFGIIGLSYEIPVSEAITIAPAGYTDLNLNHFTLGVKANYYFDDLIGISEPWDFYAGANAGYGFSMNNSYDNDLNIGLQVGGRWFWSEKWGLYLEAAGGNLGAGGGLGLTMVF